MEPVINKLPALVGVILVVIFQSIAMGTLAQLRVRSVVINSKVTAVKGRIESPQKIKDLTIFFDTGDTLTYQLNGYEAAEITTPFPMIRYTNLDGGEYQLTVRNQLNEQLEIPVSVQLTYWQRWWFWPLIAMYVIVMLGIGIYLFFLYNFRQKLKLQYIRSNIAADLHDEVGSNLNAIAIFVNLLRKNSPPESLPILNKIIDNAEESVVLMQETVWAINPKNDSINFLIERLNSFAISVLLQKGITFELKNGLGNSPVQLTMLQRKNIYLIVKEAINNSSKHSAATFVQLSFRLLHDQLVIILRDNGIGFMLDEVTSGNGLHNLNLRSAENQFRSVLISKPGEGTVLTVTVDL